MANSKNLLNTFLFSFLKLDAKTKLFNLNFLLSLFTAITGILEVLTTFSVLEPIIISSNSECPLDPIIIRSASIFSAYFLIPSKALFIFIKYSTVISSEKKLFLNSNIFSLVFLRYNMLSGTLNLLLNPISTTPEGSSIR